MTGGGARARLDAMYAELPTIECQGKCAKSCGPILMTRVEWQRICRTVGYEPVGLSPTLDCPLLVNDRCSVYAIRPTICRLWGLVESMPCQWGCVPSRVLTDAEGHAFLARAGEIGA